MTDREEEIKAAIVVNTAEILFASPEANLAAEYAAAELYNLVCFIQSIDPLLNSTEATLLTGSIIQNLPKLLELNPGLIELIKKNAEFLRSNRSVK